MSRRFITILCIVVFGGVFAGCQQKAEDDNAPAPTTTRAEADGLTHVPGRQASPQAQTPGAGLTGAQQPGVTGSKDDH